MNSHGPQEHERAETGTPPVALVVLAAAGLVAGWWLWRRHKDRIVDDIEGLIKQCDRAAEKMERTFRGHAQAS
ncbi:MAG: hypothetical protein KF884_03995 [Fimbriimonadaceae bacterium]|nr:hypothetical protein [Fimbriimonadaceae bacterium]QYK59251.1 MAG: hypothetical protein KF884_03995 [Fimbriimonadaceae bacterium]